jgi:hypothetical protein
LFKIEVKIETGGPLLEGDDIAYGDDATQPDFQHKEAKIDTGSNLIDIHWNITLRVIKILR